MLRASAHKMDLLCIFLIWLTTLLHLTHASSARCRAGSLAVVAQKPSPTTDHVSFCCPSTAGTIIEGYYNRYGPWCCASSQERPSAGLTCTSPHNPAETCASGIDEAILHEHGIEVCKELDGAEVNGRSDHAPHRPVSLERSLSSRSTACPLGSVAVGLPEPGLLIAAPRGTCCPEHARASAQQTMNGVFCCVSFNERCTVEAIDVRSCPGEGNPIIVAGSWVCQHFKKRGIGYESEPTNLSDPLAQATDNEHAIDRSEVKIYTRDRAECPADTQPVSINLGGLLFGYPSSVCCPSNALKSALKSQSGVFCCLNDGEAPGSGGPCSSVKAVNALRCRGGTAMISMGPDNLQGCPGAVKRGDLSTIYDLSFHEKRDEPMVLQVTTCDPDHVPVNAILWGDDKLRSVCCPKSHTYYTTMDPERPQAICHNSQSTDKGMFANTVASCAAGMDTVDVYHDGVMSCVKSSPTKRDLNDTSKSVTPSLAECPQASVGSSNFVDLYHPAIAELSFFSPPRELRRSQIQICDASYTAIEVVARTRTGKNYVWTMCCPDPATTGGRISFTDHIANCCSGDDCSWDAVRVRACPRGDVVVIGGSGNPITEVCRGEPSEEKRDLPTLGSAEHLVQHARAVAADDPLCPEKFVGVTLDQPALLGTQIFRWTVCCQETASDKALINLVEGSVNCCWEDVCTYPAASAGKCSGETVVVGPRKNGTTVCMASLKDRRDSAALELSDVSALDPGVRVANREIAETSDAIATQGNNDAEIEGCAADHPGVKFDQVTPSGLLLRFTACCPKEAQTSAHILLDGDTVACCYGFLCSWSPIPAQNCPGGKVGTVEIGEGETGTILCVETADDIDGTRLIVRTPDFNEGGTDQAISQREEAQAPGNVCIDGLVAVQTTAPQEGRDYQWTLCCPPEADTQVVLNLDTASARCCFGWLCSWNAASVLTCPGGIDDQMILGDPSLGMMICRSPQFTNHGIQLNATAANNETEGQAEAGNGDAQVVKDRGIEARDYGSDIHNAASSLQASSCVLVVGACICYGGFSLAMQY